MGNLFHVCCLKCVLFVLIKIFHILAHSNTHAHIYTQIFNGLLSRNTHRFKCMLTVFCYKQIQINSIFHSVIKFTLWTFMCRQRQTHRVCVCVCFYMCYVQSNNLLFCSTLNFFLQANLFFILLYVLHDYGYHLV